jgi:hypothetical protein
MYLQVPPYNEFVLVVHNTSLTFSSQVSFLELLPVSPLSLSPAPLVTENCYIVSPQRYVTVYVCVFIPLYISQGEVVLPQRLHRFHRTDNHWPLSQHNFGLISHF